MTRTKTRPGAGERTSEAASDADRLAFLAAEVRKAVAIFDGIDLADYFDQVCRREPLALAIEAASDHLAPALLIIGLDARPIPAEIPAVDRGGDLSD